MSYYALPMLKGCIADFGELALTEASLHTFKFKLSHIKNLYLALTTSADVTCRYYADPMSNP
jgi:hypothetical protein